MANFIAVTDTKSWQKLNSSNKDERLPAFDAAMVKTINSWCVDFSRSGLSLEQLQLLSEAAKECDLKKQIAAAFNGATINFTENRAVLHMSLRDQKTDCITTIETQALAFAELKRCKDFSEKIRTSKITDVVNIGIGGSDLGAKLLNESLRPYHTGPNIHYVSNVDPAHLNETLKNLNPKTTLIIVVSKTFTTQETMANALLAKDWSKGEAQFCAVTTALEKAKDFGIDGNECFGFWDWVGGRYSMWSAVGLSVMISVGAPVFQEVLDGAHSMDKHFLNAPIEENLPVLLALWDIWNVNVRGHRNMAILPYEQNLESFARWFQQLAMESNGKRVNRNGQEVSYATCPVYWGEVGTNGQHAFYQLLHQGTSITPCEFIGFAKSNYKNPKEHQLLLANMLAQAKAFAEGAKGVDAYRDFKGQRPSVTLLSDQATPARLGELFALYEHRVMAQGFLWNIPSFDQWGVELGKKLAASILTNWDEPNSFDGATKTLLSMIRKFS